MMSHDTCTTGTSRVLIVASLQRLKMEALIPAPTRLWSAVFDKIFECAEHSTDRNASSAVPGLWPHTARQTTYLLQEFGLEVFNHHPTYSQDLAPSDFHLFLHFKKFLPDQRKHFENGREAEMSITWLQSQAADFYDTGKQIWSHGMTNVSTQEMNMLKNSSILAIYGSCSFRYIYMFRQHIAIFRFFWLVSWLLYELTFQHSSMG